MSAEGKNKSKKPSAKQAALRFYKAFFRRAKAAYGPRKETAYGRILSGG